MEAHQERVVIEKDDLTQKIHRLDLFINQNEAFGNLPDREQELLIQQLGAMVEYHTALIERISLFGK